MKLLLSILLIASLSCNGQYAKKQPDKVTYEAIAVYGSLGVGFGVNNYRMNHNIGTEKQTAYIAATALTTAVVVFFAPRIYKATKKKRRKCNYKIKY